MFITKPLSPGELLAEFLALRTQTPRATRRFERLKHNDDLCPAFRSRIDTILDAYKRYQVDVHDVQGFSDDGVDVALRYTQDRVERRVGIQIKSYSEIEEAKPARRNGKTSLIQKLKAQYAQAVEVVGVEKWFIVLCCDEVKHRSTIRSIASAFKNYEKAQIILPTAALGFLRLTDTQTFALIAHLLCEDDLILKSARDCFLDFPKFTARLMTHLLCKSLTGERQIDTDELIELENELRAQDEEENDDSNETADSPEVDEEYADRSKEDLSEAVERLEESRLLRYLGHNYEIAAEEFPAMCALYFDFLFRSRLPATEMADSLIEALEL